MLQESFKNTARISQINCCTLSLDDFRKLFEIVKEQNEESKRYQLEYIDEFHSKLPDAHPQEEIDKVKKAVIDKYQVGVEIFSTKGQYYRTFNPDEAFDKTKISDDVTRIILSNTILFNLDKQLIQPYKIVVDLDFGRATLIDLVANPSHETYNPSKVEIWGLSEIWAEGVNNKILKFIKERENKRYWLHRKNIYDVFVWFIVVPILFWNLYKLDSWLQQKFKYLSSVLTVFGYIYTFLFGLILFNLFFKYLRRSFPPMELTSNIHSKGKFIRTIIIMAASALGINYLVQIVNGIFRLLF
jgi:hypothetical protein